MIENFEQIATIHMLSRDTLAAIKNRLANAMGLSADDVRFTELQRRAFNKDGFWLSSGSNRHIIIQGATSSGKTLVSEMAILDSLKNGNRKSIVLVPLRAMVRERVEKIRSDFLAQGVERVYASSSDYQEHDGEIIEGNFTVAVIVYEKFFAMLSQSQSKSGGENIPMLSECSLLVVDELQMLNSRDRGPKLEIAIQKILENNKRVQSDFKTRIMCLTTCDCKVDLIEQWLTVGNDIKPILIRSDARPAGLFEHVISYDGKIRSHRIYGERETVAHDLEEATSELKIPAAMGRNKDDDKKNAVLRKLLEKTYTANSDAKVLVYVNGRRRTRKLAEFVAGESSLQSLLPVCEMSAGMKKISNFDDDDYTKSLRERVLPRRIAFHNASLSASLREFIEGLFCDPAQPLKLVFATETLTIGMNMPVDVMILYDSQTRRAEGPIKLTSQEYKNFVGRAGRLGNANNCLGESYIIAADTNELNNFWDNYVHYRPEEILSALADVNDKDQAPYYLNLLLGKNSFTLQDFENILRESFAQKCTDRKFDAEKICKALVDAKLCYERDDDFADEDDEIHYKLTDFGAYISPYALNLKTCNMIRTCFYNGLYRKKPLPPGTLPTDVAEDDLTRYSLDIFYLLCRTDEVDRISQLKITDDIARSKEGSDILSTVRDTLQRMIDSGECELWANSPVAKILSANYLPNEREEMTYLLRAILLWYWTRGYYISDIKAKTNFKFGNLAVVQEDIARIAETVAYLLEAISNCFHVVRKSFKRLAPAAIYRFSTCVNYGMPRELVIIANKHVHNLDRKTVLKLGELWKEKKYLTYATPDQMLMRCNEQDLRDIQKILSEDDRKELIRKLEEATFHENYTILLEKIRNESTLSEGACNALGALCEGSDGADGDEDLLRPLTEIFRVTNQSADDSGAEPAFTDDVTIEELFFRAKNAFKFSCSAKKFALIAFDDRLNIADAAKSIESVKACGEFLRRKEAGDLRVILLLCGEGGLRRVLWKDGRGTLTDKNGDALLDNISVALTLKQFAFLLIQALKIKDTNGQLLASLLQDVAGEFPQSPLSTLGMLLENFAANETNDYLDGSPDLPTLRIVCDKRKHNAYHDLLRELQRQKISYRIVSWGESLAAEDVRENFYLIHLDWRVVNAVDSLRTFCVNLRRTDYAKTFAIFDSAENFLEWDGNPGYPSENLPHCESTKNFSEDIAKQLKPFLQAGRDDKLLIGVSYSHASQGFSLLEKFVAALTETFSERKIFFDGNTRDNNRLQGAGGAVRNPKYYKQCEFFVVLDDDTYSGKSCDAEYNAISERIDELPEIDGARLWFLRLPGKKPCKYFNAELDHFKTLTEENVSAVAADFIQHVTENREEGSS